MRRGAQAVAGQALMFSGTNRVTHPAVINGEAGVVVTIAERVVAIMDFTVVDDRIVAIDALADPERLSQLDLPALS